MSATASRSFRSGPFVAEWSDIRNVSGRQARYWLSQMWLNLANKNAGTYVCRRILMEVWNVCEVHLNSGPTSPRAKPSPPDPTFFPHCQMGLWDALFTCSRSCSPLLSLALFQLTALTFEGAISSNHMHVNHKWDWYQNPEEVRYYYFSLNPRQEQKHRVEQTNQRKKFRSPAILSQYVWLWWVKVNTAVTGWSKNGKIFRCFTQFINCSHLSPFPHVEGTSDF